MPKSKKAEPEPQPEPEEPEEEEEDEEDEEPEEGDKEEEEEEEAPEGETSEDRLRRLKASRRNSRRNARQAGYRKWAKAAGLKAGVPGSFGNDLLENVFSASDVARMATWCPHSADVGMDVESFKELVVMRDESLPSGPLAVLQANVESFARKIVNEVVLRSVEAGGGMTITAANVRSVLRPFNAVLRTEFNTPLGLVRAAQHVEKGEATILPRSTEEEAAIVEERKFVKANQAKFMREADKKRDAGALERKKRHAERMAGGSSKKSKKAAAEAAEASATATA